MSVARIKYVNTPNAIINAVKSVGVNPHTGAHALHFTKHCPNCLSDSSESDPITEFGYYERTVITKCVCGITYQYGG